MRSTLSCLPQWATTFVLIVATAVWGQTPGFRRDGNGQFPEARPPLKWSEEDGVLWQVPLPGKSHSSPILVKGRVIVSSDPAELIAVDAKTGKELWRRSHDYEDVFNEKQLAEVSKQQATIKALKKKASAITKQYRELLKADDPDEDKIKELKNKVRDLRREERNATKFPSVRRGGSGNSAATPVSDGQFVYVAYAHGVVACHSLDGATIWARHYPPATTGFGQSASPVLADGKVIVQFHELLALDTKTGDVTWQLEIPERWGTPMKTKVGNKTVVITPGGEIVGVEDGAVLSNKLFRLGHNSPILQDGILYALDAGTFRALRLPNAAGEKPELVWEAKTGKQRTFASPLFHKGLLYQVTETGILTVADAKSGEEVYRQRLDFGKRTRIYASVTLAGKHLFIASESGTCLVLKPGREYAEVGRNQLKGCYGSPIFDGRHMFTRGKSHLYCIRQE